ncbi:hypothetical protein [Methanolapillus millepedarum]|uniref:hypothetical protein n=1 Tax=Methanolapillus millepedarum TaxID=3028296 RepID=UPI0030B9062A
MFAIESDSSLFRTDDVLKSPNTLAENQVKSTVDNTPPTKPELMDEFRKDPDVLAVYGIIPYKSKGVDAYDWWILRCDIVDSISRDGGLDDYLYPNRGAIIGYGPFEGGYILVSVYDKDRNNVTSQDLDEMRSVFEKYATERGVSNLPIVFKCSDMGTYPEPDPEPPKPIPEFGVFISILIFAGLSGLISMKKQK